MHLTRAQHVAAEELVELIASRVGTNRDIGARHRLNLVQTAQAAALAMAFFVKECALEIGAETGFNAAAFGVVEGSKTVPPRASVPRQLLPSKKSRFKFW